MPRYDEYASSFATVSADGTTTMGDVEYEWNGSHFVKILHATLIDARETNFRIEQTARNVFESNLSVYSDIFGGHALGPEHIAWLRIAIERGLISLERAQEAFSSFRASGARPWAFDPDLPEQVAEDQELSFFGDFPGPNLRVVDLLLRPNSYVDSSATDLPSSVWTKPEGVALEQAIGAAWANHPVPAIAHAAKALLEEALPVQQGEASVDFVLTNTVNREWIQKLYLAFFLRPADPGGYNYHARELDASGTNIESIAAGFGNSPEYLQTYAGLSTAQRIDAIYRNLFNRPAEPEGLKYWGDRLDQGTFSISNIAFSILVGAQNDDRATINNRIIVANQFTATLDTQREIEAYSGLAAAAAARQLLRTVTSQTSSVSDATDKMAGAIKFLGVSGQLAISNTGDSIALGNIGKNDILIYSIADRGRLDVITSFDSNDRLELSALNLSNNVETRTLAVPQTSDSPAFFASSSVVIDHKNLDTYIYVDVNKDGGYSSADDTVIRLIGTELQPSALTL